MSALPPEELRRSVELLFESPSPPESECAGAVGVEIEQIPVAPGGRPPPADSVDTLTELAAGLSARGGRFTFEPGGQVEYSGPVRTDASSAIDDITDIVTALADAASANGIELRSRGLAPWFGPEDVGLRRPEPRYRAMDAYFERQGPWGRWMMRLSSSLQINLDFGGPAETADRWRTANSLVPLLVGTFANSPAILPGGETVRNGRAWIWDRLDPARTGRFPRGLSGAALGHEAGTVPPWSEYLAFALTAPVMFDASHMPVTDASGEPLRFSDWWLDPHRRSEKGGALPGSADWTAHLGTLFPDVRPRRWMEIRCVDVPDRPWWSVPPTLVSAILYDAEARREADRILERLLAGPGGAPGLEARARSMALADAELRSAAADLFDVAAASMARFPGDWFGAESRRAFRAFHDRFVTAGRTQADEAREAGEVTDLS